MLLLAGACVMAPVDPLEQDPGGGHVKEATSLVQANPPRARTVALAPGQLRVRLAGQEGVQSLVLRGAELGELRYTREGDQIRCSNGVTSTSFRVGSRSTSAGIQVGARRYHGELVIGLHEHEGLRVLNHVDLEDYVAGVIPSELVLWSAEQAEIEAQAIAARTYALRSMESRSQAALGAFLWDDTRDQVYLGIFQSETSPAAQRVFERYQRGLRASRKKIATSQDGTLYDVRFHASCGGMTCSPADAFPRESDLQHAPVPCEPCVRIGSLERALPIEDKSRRRVHWRWTADAASLEQLARALGLGDRLIRMDSPTIDRNARWQSVELHGDRAQQRISIEILRRELDPALLKSGRLLKTWPATGQVITGGVYFEGLGRGHGAGLCQVGSHEYARLGWSARQILQHYFPGVRLATISSQSDLSRP